MRIDTARMASYSRKTSRERKANRSVTKVYNISDLRLLSTSELKQHGNETSRAIFEARFSLEPERKHGIKTFRRQRARILTLLREREQLQLQMDISRREPIVTSRHSGNVSSRKAPGQPFFVAHLVGEDRTMKVGREYELWLERPLTSSRSGRRGPLLFVPSGSDLRIGEPGDADFLVKFFSNDLEFITPDREFFIRKQEPLAVRVKPFKSGRANLEIMVFSKDTVRLLYTQDVAMQVRGARRAYGKEDKNPTPESQPSIKLATSRLKIKQSLLQNTTEVVSARGMANQSQGVAKQDG